jgi:hypothetical protein
MLSIFTFSILAYKISAWINSWLKNLVESRILRFDSTTRFCRRKIDPTPNPDSDYLRYKVSPEITIIKHGSSIIYEE